MAKDLLIEIGTEELPPKSLKALSASFEQSFCSGLDALKLNYADVQSFASPRRLAILVSGLAEKQADSEEQKLGPAVKAAYDSEGNPTKAAMGFARGLGLEVSQLDEVDTPKGVRLGVVLKKSGQATSTLLQSVLDEAISKLPIAKRMRWGRRRDEFVRPVHWFVALFDEDVLPLEIFGLAASNISRGHRFHSAGDITLSSASSYKATLLDQKVIAHYGERRDRISSEVHRVANDLGGNAVIDESLLDEVNGLVEWPVGLGGRFDEEFLRVPSESLISSMKEHQKYFHMVDGNGALLPYFITLSNIESSNPAAVIEGNERVIRPRLADAKFFYDTDLKRSLAGNVEQLKKIVFQEKLGTVYDKTQRLSRLASFIGDAIDADRDKILLASTLCKSDLVSEMVFEFPDLQGIMGRYYALAEGLDADVAEAMEQHYWPSFAGDSLPNSSTSVSLALADRLDTLCGIFAIEQFPTGSKDPFALRRASLGILRILIEKEIDISLERLVSAALENYSALSIPSSTQSKVVGYVMERLKGLASDQGISSEAFIAVVETGCTHPLDFYRRLTAVSKFATSSGASSLANNNKRIKNILAKADSISADVDATLFSEAAETNLFAAVSDVGGRLKQFSSSGDYEQCFILLESLEQPVTSFFDDVMVNVDDLKVRENRLALLRQTRNLFLEIAAIEALAI